MGKKMKKKARSIQKEKKDPPTLTKTVSQEGTSNAEIPEEGVASIKDRVLCSHIDRGINLDKLPAKLGSSESLKCEDCRGNVADRRAKKGKGKQGKKGGINSKSESKAIWICLECGHFSCGGVGLPTTPQSHAVRHAKQNHHPLVVHYEHHQLLWCFPCNSLIPAEKTQDKHKEALNEVVKMLKKQPGEGSSVDVEEVWFGSGSVTGAIKSDYSTNIGADGKAGFSVRGLVNMGNTCFFNSIMQNLLALNCLRDYFIKLDESVGPLGASLRKIFLETSAETGLRSAINPRSLFGSLCTKAPQFRGYQQHDSHELLRCLLDGLSTEELNVRKHSKSSQVPITDPTFVDAIFGGQLSSTVSCLECGHSSTIYEPFLDLSLPVPTKKPPSKRIQHVARGKKPKLPPKRIGKNLPKFNREANAQSRESTSGNLTGGNSSDEVQSIAKPVEQSVHFSADSALSDSTDQKTIALDMGFTANDFSVIEKPQSDEAVEDVGEQSTSLDIFTWLDYVEPNPVSETNEIRAGSGNEDVLQNDLSLSITLDASVESSLVEAVAAASLDNAEDHNVLDPVLLAQQQSAFSQFEDKQNAKTQCSETDSPVAERVVQSGADVGQSSEDSSNQVCSKDPNDSEVILNPNKENASSSVELPSAVVVGDEQDSLDFDGLGDLFNEPEVSCELKPSEGSGITKNGVVGMSSESDPDEVDNADAPVSVESCLTFFTKPELLSKDEHAWQCDNCSKLLREQRTRLKRKSKIPLPEITQNDCEDGSNVGINCDKMQSMNGTLEKDVIDRSDGTSLPQNREVNENGKTEIDVINSQPEDTESQTIDAYHGLSGCSTFSNKNSNTSNVECDSDKGGSEVSEQDEGSSEKSKVKRDANKSILINKAPSILTIHLKRFSQDARGRLSKLNGHVKFREMIDLKPYVDPRCTQKEMLSYRLVGVVEHLGTMRGGHYVAYVRGSNSVWYHASDAYVREASFQEVMRCEAYILFYEGTN